MQKNHQTSAPDDYMTRLDNFRYQESRAPVPGAYCSRGWSTLLLMPEQSAPPPGLYCSSFRTMLLRELE